MEWTEDRLRIGVVGLTPGAGCSFIAAGVAGYLGQCRKIKTALVELGSGGLYFALGMDRHFTYQEFYSFYKASEGNASLRTLANPWEGVNWALKLPAEMNQQLSYREAVRLIYGISGQGTIFDFSGRKDEELWLLLKEMDLVLAVIDPLPEKLLMGQEVLERLKLSGLPVEYLINKDNKGVDQKAVLRFLKLRRGEKLPFFQPELIYGAQFLREPSWKSSEIKNAAEPVFHRILERCFPS